MVSQKQQEFVQAVNKAIFDRYGEENVRCTGPETRIGNDGGFEETRKGGNKVFRVSSYDLTLFVIYQDYLIRHSNDAHTEYEVGVSTRIDIPQPSIEEEFRGITIEYGRGGLFYEKIGCSGLL